MTGISRNCYCVAFYKNKNQRKANLLLIARMSFIHDTSAYIYTQFQDV